MQERSPEAVSKGLRALSRRELTALELRQRLERAGIAADEAAGTVHDLQAAGYQSDERAAEERARVLAGRKLGDAAIVADLARRGVSRAIIEATLAGLPSEHTRAQSIVARVGGGPRLAQTLRRKGFSSETLEKTLGAIADRD